MKLLEKIISLYAPLDCVMCGLKGLAICPACLSSLTVLSAGCYRCDTPTRSGRTCSGCRASSCIVSANAATSYRGGAKDLVWRLKFGRVQSAAEAMATRMAELYGAMVAKDVLIMPVPTATKRVRRRGYDQAVLIARSFSRQTGCEYTPLLMRLGSQEQIGADRQQRRDQLQGVFRVKNASKVVGARILLIDDVMTTGATLEAAALVLKQAGARSVGSLVFARA